MASFLAFLLGGVFYPSECSYYPRSTVEWDRCVCSMREANGHGELHDRVRRTADVVISAGQGTRSSPQQAEVIATFSHRHWVDSRVSLVSLPHALALWSWLVLVVLCSFRCLSYLWCLNFCMALEQCNCVGILRDMQLSIKCLFWTVGWAITCLFIKTDSSPSIKQTFVHFFAFFKYHQVSGKHEYIWHSFYS